jgi:hypothetical protein
LSGAVLVTDGGLIFNSITLDITTPQKLFIQFTKPIRRLGTDAPRRLLG